MKQVQAKSPSKRSSNTFTRNILPLLAFSAKACLPTALQLPTQLLAFLYSLFHTGEDLRSLIQDGYRNFFAKGNQRHLREGLTNLLLNTLQIYVSAVTTIALCWYNGGLHNIFQTEITEQIQKTVMTGAHLCKSGISMLVNNLRKNIQNGKLNFIDNWLKNNRIFIAFSLLLNNLIQLNSYLSLLVQPLAIFYAATAMYMILDTLHNIVFAAKDPNNDPMITDSIHTLNSITWLSMFTIAIDTLYPLTQVYIPFRPSQSDILRKISAFSIITTEILTECFCASTEISSSHSAKPTTASKLANNTTAASVTLKKNDVNLNSKSVKQSV